MKQELIEIKTKDQIILDGILFVPNKKSSKTVIHVHGLSDNFYQKKFIKVLAKIYAQNGYNYLSFNNRGHDYATRLLSSDKKINGGSYCELFNDSILDIESAIEYVKQIGTEEIILEGHSLGCSKVINYYSKNQLSNIKKIILLAPCDGIMKVKQVMSNGYDKYLEIAKEQIGKGKPNAILFSESSFPQTYTAQTFATDYVEESALDIFRYRDKNYKSESLKKVKIPILIVVGTKDKMAFISENDDITPFFKRNLTNNYNIVFIPESNHDYNNYESALGDIINKWMTK